MANTWTTLLDAVYPVGSVYISYNTTSPATLFGGTWNNIADYFPYFVTATSSSTVGVTGGANTIELDLNHNHTMHLNWGAGIVSAAGGYNENQCGLKYGEGDASIPKPAVFVGQSKDMDTSSSEPAIDPKKGATTWKNAAKPLNTVTFNNRPVYVTMFAWRRTA